jgi:4a-hydroxytetrahydrobiopterin dehydratase
MVKTAKELAALKCVPCRGGIPPLDELKIQSMMPLIDNWSRKTNPDRIERMFKFKNFTEALAFVNKIGQVAEEEDHHPDIYIHWNEVSLTLWTHAINGLFDNDFVMAAKIDKIP